MTRFIPLTLVAAFVTACMSTSDPLGPASSTWSDYRSWHKVNQEPMTGDPTGRLSGVHDGLPGYRNIFVNSTGESTNRGNSPYPYPAGTILVKESYNNLSALEAERNPELTVMIKLAAGSSPETAGWEYVRPDGARGNGSSGLAVFCRDCHAFAAATDFNFINSRFFESNQ